MIALLRIFLFPGLLFLAAFGLCLEYLDRILYARLQNRIGPPWYQPLADIVKLASKEAVVPAEASPGIFKAIPLFALAAFTGLVDGLVRRDLRKFGSGRESSYLYHKARGTIIPLTIVPWTVYLAIPISISPLLILLPCAVLLGVSVYITVSSFKKYL